MGIENNQEERQQQEQKMSYFCVTSRLWRRFPGGASGKEPACQCRRCGNKRCGFDAWVRRFPGE